MESIDISYWLATRGRNQNRECSDRPLQALRSSAHEIFLADQMSDLILENDFWEFSVATYSAPGVADECIALQDRYGVDVNIVLFSAWLGRSRKVRLMPQDVEAIDSIVASWREGVVKPLRAARRSIAADSQYAFGELRTHIKCIELEAERIEQAMLFAYTKRQWSYDEDAQLAILIRSNLEAVLNIVGCRPGKYEELPFTHLYDAVLALRVAGATP